MWQHRLGIFLVFLGIACLCPVFIWPHWATAAFSLIGLNLLAIGLTYFINRPDFLGKVGPGKRRLWAHIVWAPYLTAIALAWHARRCWTREPIFDLISPGIYCGRRPRQGELPGNVKVVVDLTAEFMEPRAIRDQVHYMMLPLLDGAYPPDLAVFSAFIASTASQEGDIYIHCAYGHGRAALTTAALLLHRGLVTTAQEAQSMLKKARPGTHLNSAQRNCLKHYVSATSLPDPASSEDAASTTAPVTTAAEADASSEPVER